MKKNNKILAIIAVITLTMTLASCSIVGPYNTNYSPGNAKFGYIMTPVISGNFNYMIANHSSWKPGGPKIGYTNATSNELGTKVGYSSAYFILGIYFDADLSIKSAAEQGGITEISTVEIKSEGFWGLFEVRYTIVTGK